MDQTPQVSLSAENRLQPSNNSSRFSEVFCFSQYGLFWVSPPPRNMRAVFLLGVCREAAISQLQLGTPGSVALGRTWVPL